MLALYSIETHFDSKATDGKGSYGIPQMQVNTAQIVVDGWGDNYTVTPDVLATRNGLAIKISCSHMRDLVDGFHGDYIKATRAYNAGSGCVCRGYFKVGHPCLPGMSYFHNVLAQYQAIKAFENRP